MKNTSADCCPKPRPDCCPKKPCEKLFEQGLELPAGKYPAAYNAPACICLRNSWDFDVTASFIYWHVSQESMDTAVVFPTSLASPLLSHPGAVAYQQFKYKPGFKVGLGLNLDHDDWVLRAEYTWLHQKVSSSETAPSTPTGPGTWSSNDWDLFIAFGPVAAASVSSSWKMKLDMVDVVMDRPFYEGTMLTVSPYGGMRALWLRQRFNITYPDTTGTVLSLSQNRSSCWALGPTAGVGGHWLLGAGFRFEGNAGASILYTRYTKISTTQHRSVPIGTLDTTSSLRNYNALRPVGQLAVGVGWGMYTCGNEFYFDVALDYEFLYFWDQNVMRMWVSNLQAYVDHIGDLQMHGLTATFRFDF
jgi:hypothetical protein